MSADRLAEIKARAEDATPEDVPWLVDQVESLERWKVEAIEVMSGLRELGRALGLGLGVQITGPAALAEVQRLTAERDAAIERLERVIDQWRETGRAVISEMNRADKAEAERDALAAAHARESKKVWKVEEVMNDIEGSDPTTWERLRAALAGSEADTSDVDVCSGDADCTSALHVHGCFADTTGPCTDPDEHQPTAGSGWVE